MVNKTSECWPWMRCCLPTSPPIRNPLENSSWVSLNITPIALSEFWGNPLQPWSQLLHSYICLIYSFQKDCISVRLGRKISKSAAMAKSQEVKHFDGMKMWKCLCIEGTSPCSYWLASWHRILFNFAWCLWLSLGLLKMLRVLHVCSAKAISSIPENSDISELRDWAVAAATWISCLEKPFKILKQSFSYHREHITFFISGWSGTLVA